MYPTHHSCVRYNEFSRPLFIYFSLFMFDSKQVFNIQLADDMTVFELQTSGGRSDRSTN